MNLPDEKRDQVAEVLVRARFRGLGGMTEAEACRYLADALAPVVARWLAEARREALREAADELLSGPHDHRDVNTADWLRELAALAVGDERTTRSGGSEGSPG